MTKQTPMGDESKPVGSGALRLPSSEQMLEGVVRLASKLHLELSEEDLVKQFLSVLRDLFPGRHLLVRVFEPRNTVPARIFSDAGNLREGVAGERISLKQSSIEKTRVKTAIAESARLKIGGDWDSPFHGVAAGFSVPLVASGELYGVVDVGYDLGVGDHSEEDESRILPIVNQLSVALRNERLHRETTVLRDYQAKLIEHANALILGVDQNWRITVCNHALCRLWGHKRSDLIGRDLRDLVPGRDRSRLTKMFMKALAGNSADNVDIEFETRQGDSVRTVWSVAAISGRGAVQAVVAIGQDQTRLRELQSQVIQAEKLATLGQLAAGVVHELNNPLTSITVYAEYLLKKAESRAKDGDADSQADISKLERIYAGAQRIMTFAKDLVQYAKPAGDELDMIAVNSVISQSLSFCEHLFDRSGVTLRKMLADDLPPIYAVAGQIEQVVINLVTNAVHACEHGGAVEVVTLPKEGRVVIRIADSGHGIAEADRERVFEPFFTTKTDGKGTGLGLSIVKNIVEQHQGTVWIEASSMGGATFVCSLPAAQPQ